MDMTLTVGELRKRMADKPDDAPVYIERIHDVYFEKHGWTTVDKPESKHEEATSFIRAFSTAGYRDDPSLYIVAHY